MRAIVGLCSLLAILSIVALGGCGGRTPDLILGEGDAGADAAAFEDAGGTCTVMPCPSDAPWNPMLCACVYIPDDSGIGEGDADDASGSCTSVNCPYGWVAYSYQSGCVCMLPGEDAGEDAPGYFEDAAVYDAYAEDVWTYPSPDGSYSDAAPPQEAGCPYFYYCGDGFYLSSSCECAKCADTCPAGQTPGQGCSGCTACTTRCPPGFEYGQGCGCVPGGVDAGGSPPANAGDGGGGCLLEGYQSCAAGAWCPLGTCPDGTTQYGCYCSPDGTATCSLACPSPPACEIPGQGTCPYGSECVYGSCSAGEVLVCTCNSANAYCSTYRCEDGGLPFDAGSAGDGGPAACLLEGYYSCSAGTYCALGTCPDGTTTYGCTCNRDGTASCDLTCPPPGPCVIPGEGTCPYGGTCTFGCAGGAETGLYCVCESGENASCFTFSCNPYADAGAD